MLMHQSTLTVFVSTVLLMGTSLPGQQVVQDQESEKWTACYWNSSVVGVDTIHSTFIYWDEDQFDRDHLEEDGIVGLTEQGLTVKTSPDLIQQVWNRTVDEELHELVYSQEGFILR